MTAKATASRTSAKWHHAASPVCASSQDALRGTDSGLAYTLTSIRQPKFENQEVGT